MSPSRLLNLASTAIVLVVGAGTGMRAYERHWQQAALKPGPVVPPRIGQRLPSTRLDVHNDKLRNQYRLTREETTLGALASSSRCSLFIFFESSCEWCHELAKQWTGVSSVSIGAATLPVRWITVNRSDEGAGEFVASLHQSQPWYAVRSLSDAHALGVRSWPAVYIVGHDGEYFGLASPTPAKIEQVPNACGDFGQHTHI